MEVARVNRRGETAKRTKRRF